MLVEQNVALSLKLASRAYVLENGRITLSGTGARPSGRRPRAQAYLGCDLERLPDAVHHDAKRGQSCA